LIIARENHLGTIEVSKKYLSALISREASACFGVADMNPPRSNIKLFQVLNQAALPHRRGVSLKTRGGGFEVSVHITVLFGTNIKAVTESLAHKIRYSVEEKTGIKIPAVSVYIDGIVTN